MKIKKLLLCIITVFSMLTVSSALAEGEINVVVDGNKVEFTDQQPVIIDGRTLVPIRAVMERMGKQVGWDGETNQVTVSDEYITVKLSIDSNIMNNKVTDPVTGEVFEYDTELDVAPTVINDRTCLPIRAVVEAFGISVSWDEETNSVLILSDSLLC